MSELPEAPPPAHDSTKPSDSTTATQKRTNEAPVPGDPATDQNPHIGDVLADPNTNGERQG